MKSLNIESVNRSVNEILKPLNEWVDTNIIDKVGKFYVVTQPTPTSELIDCVFECTVTGMMRQALGGLKQEEIIAIYTKETEAKKHGQKMMDAIKGK